MPTIGWQDAEASSETFRPHHALTGIGPQTREIFFAALAKRFLPGYGEALNSRTHLLDNDMLLSPNTRKLKYIDLLLSSTAGKATHLATASEIKGKINAEVIAILTASIVEIRARAKAAAVGGEDAGPAQGGEAASTGQRPKTTHAAAAASHNVNWPKDAGVFDDIDDSGVDLESPHERAPKEEAKALFEDWLALKVRFKVGTRASTRFCNFVRNIPSDQLLVC